MTTLSAAKQLGSIPTCRATEAIRERGLMAPWIGRALGLDAADRVYKSLEDRAITKARVIDLATGQRRARPISEAEARAALKRLWDALVKSQGAERAAASFFHNAVGVVSCAYPCEPVVDFDSPTELHLDCLFRNNFSADMTPGKIQREVFRIATLLGIEAPDIAGKPVSKCPPERRKLAASRDDAPKRAVFTTAQRVMATICTDVMMQTFTKGALMWHTVGAGKTCAAVACASVLINKGWRVKWFSTATGKYEPLFDAFFARLCHSFDDLKLDVRSKEARTAEVRKYIQIWSFSQLAGAFRRPKKNDYAAQWLREAAGRYGPGKQWEDANWNGTDPLYKTLIIMDEPHKIPQIANANERMDWPTVTRAIRASYAQSGANSCRLLLMDATPMLDDPSQLAVMLNALHERDVVPDTWEGLVSGGLVSTNGDLTVRGTEAFTRLGKGVISYFNYSADRSTFAYAKKLTFNPVALSQAQRDKMFKGADSCHAKKARDRRRLCVEKAAVAVNMPRAATKAAMAGRARDSFPLLDELVRNVAEQDRADAAAYPGRKFKHVIFTNVKDAAHAKNIVKVLEFRGFREVDPLTSNKPAGTDKGVIMLAGEGLSNAITVKGTGERREKKDVIISAFNNHETNLDGQVARFMVVDGRFREGINLFDVRHFHLLQPLSSFEERQAIGRVLRMCGSSFLPADDALWQVRVHLYDAVDASTRESIYDLLDVVGDSTKQRAMDATERLAASIAFDRLIFTQYNQPVPETDYEIKYDVQLGHLCATPVVNGQCPDGKSVVVHPSGAECCDVVCKGKTQPDAAGKCPARFIAGPSEVDPRYTCCYSVTSKRGKELAAAKKAGLPPPAPAAPKPAGAAGKPVTPDAPHGDSQDAQGASSAMDVDGDSQDAQGASSAMDVDGDSQDAQGASSATDVDLDSLKLDAVVDGLEAQRASSAMDVDVDSLEQEAALAPPTARGKKKASCQPPKYRPVRKDGTCAPGFKRVTRADGQACCTNACGAFSKPTATGVCPKGKEAFQGDDGVTCCRAVKKRRSTTVRATPATAKCPKGSRKYADCPATAARVVATAADGKKCCKSACPQLKTKPVRGKCPKGYVGVTVDGQLCCRKASQ
jgi:hypothetical protein